MRQTRRRFSKEFKKQVVEEVRSGLMTAAEGALLNKIAELERKVGQ